MGESRGGWDGWRWTPPAAAARAAAAAAAGWHAVTQVSPGMSGAWASALP